mmetsp:Transcript_111793/g.238803  ORF Transcript_111793/g.238803 Transcript_111793/m.238803 type:complete len:243 (-) Transcript_111793:555-1283(-)
MTALLLGLRHKSASHVGHHPAAGPLHQVVHCPCRHLHVVVYRVGLVLASQSVSHHAVVGIAHALIDTLLITAQACRYHAVEGQLLDPLSAFVNCDIVFLIAGRDVRIIHLFHRIPYILNPLLQIITELGSRLDHGLVEMIYDFLKRRPPQLQVLRPSDHHIAIQLAQGDALGRVKDRDCDAEPFLHFPPIASLIQDVDVFLLEGSREWEALLRPMWAERPLFLKVPKIIRLFIENFTRILLE